MYMPFIILNGQYSLFSALKIIIFQNKCGLICILHKLNVDFSLLNRYVKTERSMPYVWKLSLECLV